METRREGKGAIRPRESEGKGKIVWIGGAEGSVGEQISGIRGSGPGVVQGFPRLKVDDSQ